MKVVIITLTDSDYNSARTIQISRVVESLQNEGVETTVFTVVNEELKGFDHTKGRIIYLPPERQVTGIGVSGLLNRILLQLRRIFPLTNKFAKRAINTILAYIDTEEPDCIISSSNPLSSHFIAYTLKKQTDLPWIASFSDPRPNSILPPPYNENVKIIRSIAEKYWLTKVLSKCDAIHMPSMYGIELTAEAFNLPLQLKSYAIPHIGVNNVDLEAFGEDGWIVHTGKLDRTRVSTEFLQAVKLARTQIPEKFKGLICVGVVQNEFREEVKALEMEDSVRIMDQMPHSDASWIMAAASALVVLEADMRVSPFLPSKFADYAVSGKYIIAVTPETSIIREYLNGSNVGIAVRHDRNEIAEGIINIFNRETNSDLPKSNFAELFSLQSVGREYSRMIMDAVGPQ